VLTDINNCKTREHIRLPDPPTAIEFPEGCMRLCDTMLPLTVPMSIVYDYWKLFHDGIAVDSGMGVPTFRITGPGRYYLELTKDICTITTGELDVDIIDCAPCECELVSLQVDTLKDIKENCIYYFFRAYHLLNAPTGFIFSIQVKITWNPEQPACPRSPRRPSPAVLLLLSCRPVAPAI
jgi:hypothetical protein